MRLLRPVLFSFLGFCSAIVTYPRTLAESINSGTLCGILTADNVCLSLASDANSAVAIVPSSVTKLTPDWDGLLSQRSSEFDDDFKSTSQSAGILNGIWIYTSPTFGQECSITSEMRESHVTIQQSGTQFISRGSLSYEGHGTQSEAIGNGVISSDRIESSLNGLSWVGHLSPDGNNISGTYTCVMQGISNTVEFLMTRIATNQVPISVSSNITAPPFPIDPGPNQPLRRPDFEDFSTQIVPQSSYGNPTTNNSQVTIQQPVFTSPPSSSGTSSLPPSNIPTDPSQSAVNSSNLSSSSQSGPSTLDILNTVVGVADTVLDVVLSSTGSSGNRASVNIPQPTNTSIQNQATTGNTSQQQPTNQNQATIGQTRTSAEFYNQYRSNMSAIPVPGCAVDPGGSVDQLSIPEIQEILWEHNRARSEADPYVPSNAPPLPEVTWSCEVAQVAQAWADQSQGTQGHSSGEWRQQQFTRLTGFQGRAANLGEDLGWMFDSSKNTNVADSVRQFINEREVYDHQNGNCTPTGDIKTCGHYTQVIWRESVLVGCGVTRNYPSSSGSNYGHFLVCSYHNAGNANNDNPLAIHPDWYYQSATQSINGSTQSQTPTGNTGNTSQQPTTGSSRNQSSINIPESQQPNTSTQNQNSSQKTLVPFFKKPFQGNFRMVNPFDHHFPLQFEHYNDIVVNFLGEQLS